MATQQRMLNNDERSLVIEGWRYVHEPWNELNDYKNYLIEQNARKDHGFDLWLDEDGDGEQETPVAAFTAAQGNLYLAIGLIGRHFETEEALAQFNSLLVMLKHEDGEKIPTSQWSPSRKSFYWR